MTAAGFLAPAAIGAVGSLAIAAGNVAGVVTMNIDSAFIAAIGASLAGLIAAVTKMRQSAVRQRTEMALLRAHVEILKAALASAGMPMPPFPTLKDLGFEAEPR